MLSARGRAGLWPLLLCAVIAPVVYFVAFTVPYPIRVGIERPLQHFGHLSGPSVGATLGLIGALALLFALYLWSLRLCQTLEPSRKAFLVILSGSVLSALALLWMYPVFSLDIFYYMAADRIWSVFRENPFVVPPLQAAHDPFFPYTRWGHYPLPYGPLWPWVSALTSSFGGGMMEPTILGFKALGAL